MSYRPDENILISWLYGELDEVEKAKVEKYFQENPEKLKEMQQLRDVSNVMGKVQDKEVIAPPLFMDSDNDVKVVSFWRSGSFKTVISIAASFLVLIFAAKLLNLNIHYSDNELRIAFGEKTEIQTPPSLNANDVQKMIDSSLDQSIKTSLANNSSQINDLVKKASSASQTDIKQFVATMQRDNLAQLRDYLQLSGSEQRKYTDNLIVEFSKYLQEQRSQDLNMYQTRFSRLEQNTDQLKTETEQILASIISSSNQIQQSSY
jgi:hypothetical protein